MTTATRQTKQQTAVVPRQLTLDELAAVANDEHRQCEAAIGSVLQHAKIAGDALNDAKSQLRHGEWLPWLAKNFEGHIRDAARYMKIAANWTRVSNLPSMRQALGLLAAPDSKAHVANNSGDNEWYTPEQYVAAAREVLGAIDLDPASSPQANEIVQAQDYYTADDDGLEQEWGGRVWMNPPYASDLIGKFTEKMAESYDAGTVSEGIVLVNNATETQWFQRLARSAKAICFPERRVRFWNSEGDLGAPLQGQAFVFLGQDHDRFAERFAEFGLVVEVCAG